MRVELAYGREGLALDVPDDAVVITGRELPGLDEQQRAIGGALRAPLDSPPLRELARAGQRVVVVFPDHTRPMPNRTVLPPLLAELEEAGVRGEDVTLLCSTGSHRVPTDSELDELLGPEIHGRYRVVAHEATASDHAIVGTVDGVAVELDREYLDADLRIVTGFVEPHVFAGFSGGPKAVCPGVAALPTILEAHSPPRIGSERATWLVTDGNPVHDFVRAAAALAQPDFSVDVTINSRKEVTAVFAGALWSAHAAARAFSERTVVQTIPERCDVVVTTNGGYPLDRNLYQCIKGLAAAERVAHPGAAILLAAECADGLPLEGDFGRILRESPGVAALVDTSNRPRLDNWSAQVLGRVVARADVGVFSAGLTDDELATARVRRIADLSEALERALDERPGARVCVQPRGPLTVASVAA